MLEGGGDIDFDFDLLANVRVAGAWPVVDSDHCPLHKAGGAIVNADIPPQYLYPVVIGNLDWETGKSDLAEICFHEMSIKTPYFPEK